MLRKFASTSPVSGKVALSIVMQTETLVGFLLKNLPLVQQVLQPVVCSREMTLLQLSSVKDSRNPISRLSSLSLWMSQ